jgi:hypothetical protein
MDSLRELTDKALTDCMAPGILSYEGFVLHYL